MNRLLSLRRTFVLAAVAVPLGSVTAIGYEAWAVPDYEQQIAESAAEHERMHAVDETVKQRIRVKETVVGELLGGRMTLAEAVEQFLALNAGHPAAANWVRDNVPGDTDEERTARNVIDYALVRAKTPAEREALSCKLSAELAELAGRSH